MFSALLRSSRNVAQTATALFLGLAIAAVPVRAGVDVHGDAGSVHVIAHQATVAEVLNVLSTNFRFRYDAMTSLDAVISGTYRGSLERVVKDVLSGFNYVITTRKDGIQVIVVGRPVDSPPPVAPAQSALPKNTDPAAQWRSSAAAARKP